jgi:hypothetical protein
VMMAIAGTAAPIDRTEGKKHMVTNKYMSVQFRSVFIIIIILEMGRGFGKIFFSVVILVVSMTTFLSSRLRT